MITVVASGCYGDQSLYSSPLCFLYFNGDKGTFYLLLENCGEEKNIYNTHMCTIVPRRYCEYKQIFTYMLSLQLSGEVELKKNSLEKYTATLEKNTFFFFLLQFSF